MRPGQLPRRLERQVLPLAQPPHLPSGRELLAYMYFMFIICILNIAISSLIWFYFCLVASSSFIYSLGGPQTANKYLIVSVMFLIIFL